MEQTTENSFYVTLPSIASPAYFPNNSCTQFKVQLPRAITLEGNWEVALTQLTCTAASRNVPEALEFLMAIEKLSSGASKGLSAEGVNDPVVRGIVPKGNYPSIEELCLAINKAITKAVCQYSANQTRMAFARFFYDRSTQTVSLYANWHPTPEDSRSSVFFYIMKGHKTFADLGFQHLCSTENAIAMLRAPTQAAARATFSAPTKFALVTSDLVAFQIYGDTHVQLLRLVPLDDSGRLDTVDIDKRQYVPVAKGYISSISVELRRSPDEVAKFCDGNTIVVLHFKRTNI